MTQFTDGQKVCIALAEYLTTKESHRYKDKTSVETWRKAVGTVTEEELEIVKRDESLPFLTRRLAEAVLSFRSHHRQKSYGPKNPNGPAVLHRPIQRSVDEVLREFGKPEFRLECEYDLIFSYGSFGHLFKLLAKIKSPESLPFLESFYDWKPRRLIEYGVDSPVRRYIAETLGAYYSLEALELINRLWTEIATTDEDKNDLVGAVASRSDWKPLLDGLSDEVRARMAKFLEQLKCHELRVFRAKDAAKKNWWNLLNPGNGD